MIHIHMPGMLLLGALLLSGCGGGGSEHGHVTGVVKVNGTPVPDAMITFAPKEGGRAAVAVTDAEGNYELNYTPGVKGAKLGPNDVRITNYKAPELDDNNQVVSSGRPEKFPPKYSSGKEVTVDVKSGENTFDFDVEADKDKYPPPRG